MRRYLVVANQTLAGDALMAKLKECVAAGPTRLHVVVPATDPGEHFVATDGEARAVAQRRLGSALERFATLGAEVTGEVGDRRPIEAIRDAMRHAEFDEIILSTLPPGPSRWLKQDLPHRLSRTVDLPVTHVIGAVEPAVSGPPR